MKTHYQLILPVTLVTAASLSAWVPQDTLQLNTFQNGTVANATTVNENFEALRTRGDLTGANIINGSLTADDLALDAVGNAELQDDSITGAKVSDGSLGPGDVEIRGTGPGYRHENDSGSMAVQTVMGENYGSLGVEGGTLWLYGGADQYREFYVAQPFGGGAAGFTRAGFGPGTPFSNYKFYVRDTHEGVDRCFVASGGNWEAVYAEGNLSVTGTKNFVQPHPEDPAKEIVMSCLEGNESGTYFRGKTHLFDGRAVIEVPEEFRLASEAEGLTVQLTKVGRGDVWVESYDANRVFIAGDVDLEVHYLVNGIRRGFREHQAFRENRSFIPTSEGEFGTHYPEAYRQVMVENGILNPDFTPNRETARRLGWELTADESEKVPSQNPVVRER